jgi:heme exporter protein A
MMMTGMSAKAHQSGGADATAQSPVVQVRALGKIIDERPILEDLNFDVPRGCITALLGANGAGKSTLLRILATLTPPTAGTLTLFGRRAGGDDPALRSRIGMIGHNAMLYRELSARENLLFFGRLYDVPSVESKASQLLEQVDLLSRADDPVKAFSRGMLQRVSIARALMNNPELLLADEPFTGLDAPSRAIFEQLLDGIRKAGTAIVLANHDVAQSIMLADRVLVLRNGRQALDSSSVDVDVDQVFAVVGVPKRSPFAFGSPLARQ